MKNFPIPIIPVKGKRREYPLPPFSTPARAVFLVLCALFLFTMLPDGNVAVAQPASRLESGIQGQRFTATRAYNAQIGPERAETVARTAAHAMAMRSLMRFLVTLPEVRVAANAIPDLLAVAYAVGHTESLLVSHSRRDCSVTVTVALTEKTDANAIEVRVREALIHPGRLRLYEEALLREAAILDMLDTLYPIAQKPPDILPPRLPEADVQKITELVNELQALALYKAQLPSWNGVWENPVATRDIMREALVLAPGSALIHNALGDAWLQLGRAQAAMEEQTSAIKNAPTFARAYHGRGLAAMAMGLLSSATADISEAIRLSPETSLFYRDRGLAAHLQGNVAAMCADFHKACALGDCLKLEWAFAEQLCGLTPFKE